jgi:hypothetical protein
LHQWVGIDHSLGMALVNVTLRQKYNNIVVLAMLFAKSF